MAKSSIIITTQDHITGNPQQKTVTDLNPQVSDANLKTFAQMTAALSKDSYVKADRVDKRNLDTDSKPSRPVSKINCRTGSQSAWLQGYASGSVTVTAPVSDFATNKVISLTPYTPLEVVPQIIDLQASNNASWTVNAVTCNQNNSDPYWSRGITCQGDVEPSTVAFTLHFDETPTYTAYDLRVTVTIEADPQEGGEG